MDPNHYGPTLDRRDMYRAYKCGREGLDTLIKHGWAPEPVYLPGVRGPRWLTSEVDRYLDRFKGVIPTTANPAPNKDGMTRAIDALRQRRALKGMEAPRG